MEDNESSFLQLITRLEETINYLRKFKPEEIDGTETKSISLPVGEETITFEGQSFGIYFILPNVYFHVRDCLRYSSSLRGRAGEAGLSWLPGRIEWDCQKNKIDQTYGTGLFSV